MASQTQLRTEGSDLVLLAGSFQADGTSGVDGAKGFGYTVANGGTGVYTLTFDNKYAGLQSFVCNIPCAAGGTANVVGYTKSYDAATGVLTLTFRVAAGSATEPIDDGEFNWVAVFQRSSALGTGY